MQIKETGEFATGKSLPSHPGILHNPHGALERKRSFNLAKGELCSPGGTPRREKIAHERKTAGLSFMNMPQ